MVRTLLHVFRNTPLGRETLLQSAHFCEAVGCRLEVYVPRHSQFLLYFDDAVATVGLDGSYLREPATAEARVTEALAGFDVQMEFLEPTGFTAPTLPNVPSEHAFMTCPRSMSEHSSRIRFGHLGPRVRAIVQTAPYPVLLPTPVFKPWNEMVACYGGSDNSLRAVLAARGIARAARVPLSLFTLAEGKAREWYEKPLEREGLLEAVRSGEIAWRFVESESLAESLYDVPREALVVAGAYGHGVVREALFGSKLEIIQTEVPNNLMIAGPRMPSASI